MDLKPKISTSSRVYTHPQGSKPVKNTKGKKPTGRNVGKLMQIMNVPVDVFYEIASHLSPLDILHLARVSKELRDMLMSRKSRSIWITARKNFNPPLPDCPNDLSEPQYASIALETRCMACGIGRATWKVNYAARVRFCGPCWKENIRSGKVLSKDLDIQKDSDLAAVIFNMLPDASGEIIRKVHTELQQSARNMFYEAEFIAVLEKYKEIHGSKDKDALEKYVAERVVTTLERLNFQTTMRAWEGNRTWAKLKADRDVYATREAAIMEKLKELGYQESDLPSHRGADIFAITHQPRPLTPRIWNTVRPALIRIIEDERVRREKEAFKQKWLKRIKELSTYYKAFLLAERDKHAYKRMLPNAVDALDLPCMNSLLTSAEPQETVTEADFIAVQADLLHESENIYLPKILSDLVKRYRLHMETGKDSTKRSVKTRSKAKKGKGKGKKRATDSDDFDEDSGGESEAATGKEPDAGPGGLTDADSKMLNDLTTLFSCNNWCSRFLTYTQLIEHWQVHHAFSHWSTPGKFTKVHEGLEYRRALVAPVLKALGLPETSTVADFDAVVYPGVPGSLECSCKHSNFAYPYSMNDLSDHCGRENDGSPPMHQITFVPRALDTIAAASSSKT